MIKSPFLESSTVIKAAISESENSASAAIAAGLKVVVVPDLKHPSDFVQANFHQVVESLAHWLNVIA